MIWPLNSYGTKTFIPRLGALITNVLAATNTARIAVTTSDDCVRVISAASMRDEWVVNGLCLHNEEHGFNQIERNVYLSDKYFELITQSHTV